jgi:hypothetical protein
MSGLFLFIYRMSFLAESAILLISVKISLSLLSRGHKNVESNRLEMFKVLYCRTRNEQDVISKC